MRKKPKIPLPWANTEEESNREKNTRIYWYTETAWNGRNKGTYTVGDAIQDVNVILNSTPPNTPLHHLAIQLREDLIIHGNKRTKLKEHPEAANTNITAKTFVI